MNKKEKKEMKEKNKEEEKEGEKKRIFRITGFLGFVYRPEF
jgi:hypothetical protein